MSSYLAGALPLASISCALLLSAGCAGPDPAEDRARAEATAAADPAYLEHKRRFERLYSARDYSGALIEAVAAIETAPVLEEPYIWASRLHTDLGRDLKALQYFDRMGRRYPELPWPWFYRGYHEWHLGRLDEALESFRKTAELDPENAKCYYRQGVVLHRLGDFEEAARVLRRAHELDAGAADTITLLADVLRFTGDYEAAERFAAAGLDAAGDSAKLHHTMGLLLLRRDDHAGAERQLRRSIELDPSLAKAHQDLARLLFRTGREQEAVTVKADGDRLAEYERGKRELGTVFAATGDPHVRVMLAELELTAGQYPQAFMLFAGARRMLGDNDRILAGQVEALYRGGEAANAQKAAEGLAGVETGRADLARACGLIAEADFEMAKRALDSAVARGPEEREFLRRVAETYDVLGLEDAEQRTLERAAAAPRLHAELNDRSR